jgi:hypothetical protein
MKKIILATFILSSQLSFAQDSTTWDNPAVCNPSNVKPCWIRCYNSKSVLEGSRRYEVYITPGKARSTTSTFILNQERLLRSGMKTILRGEVNRDDLSPLSYTYQLNSKTLLKASIAPDMIILNNGWTLTGELKYENRSYEMFCSYQNKLWMETYESIYSPSFPHKFFNDFYNL